MKRKVSPNAFLLVLVALIAPAWAGSDDPSCHETATKSAWSPTDPMTSVMMDPERVEFFSNCKEKSNVALYCTKLTKTIWHKDPGANTVIKYFVADKGPCTDKDSVQAYCKLMTTYDGLRTLIEEPNEGYSDPFDPEMDMPPQIVERSAKICGTTREALLSKFCTVADTPKDWNLAEQWCPKEGKVIFMRECAKGVSEFAPHDHLTTNQCEEEYRVRVKRKF